MVAVLCVESTWLLEEIIQSRYGHLEGAEPHPKSVAKLSHKSTPAQLHAEVKLLTFINVSKLG